MYSLADLGEARDHSTNSIVINYIFNPLPQVRLQRCQKLEDMAKGHKIDFSTQH